MSLTTLYSGQFLVFKNLLTSFYYPFFFFFFNCMFYQLLCVQLHSCSSTQSWGSVLPSIFETRDQNSEVAPFSFQIEIWDLFVHRGQKSYTPTAFGKLWTTPGVRCMIHASS